MGAELEAILLLAGIYAIPAIAIQIGITCGAFSLAPLGWMCIGAYVAALAATKWAMDPALALSLAMLGGLVLGPLIMLPVGRIAGLYFALVSLAFVLVIQSTVSHTAYTGAALGLYGVPLATEVPQVVLALAACCALAHLLSLGRIGRALRAAGQDPDVAQALGVNVLRLRLAIGGIAGAMSVMAGFLYAGYVGYVDPAQFSFALVVQIIVMVFVGGRTHWAGAVLGAYFIMLLPYVLRPLADWRDIANGAMLILVAVLFPTGLFGLIRTGLHRLWPRRDALAALAAAAPKDGEAR